LSITTYKHCYNLLCIYLKPGNYIAMHVYLQAKRSFISKTVGNRCLDIDKSNNMWLLLSLLLACVALHLYHILFVFTMIMRMSSSNFVAINTLMYYFVIICCDCCLLLVYCCCGWLVAASTDSIPTLVVVAIQSVMTIWILAVNIQYCYTPWCPS